MKSKYEFIIVKRGSAWMAQRVLKGYQISSWLPSKKFKFHVQTAIAVSLFFIVVTVFYSIIHSLV